VCAGGQHAATNLVLPVNDVQQPVYLHASRTRVRRLRNGSQVAARDDSKRHPEIHLLAAAAVYLRRATYPGVGGPPLVHLSVHLPGARFCVERRHGNQLELLLRGRLQHRADVVHGIVWDLHVTCWGRDGLQETAELRANCRQLFDGSRGCGS